MFALYKGDGFNIERRSDLINLISWWGIFNEDIIDSSLPLILESCEDPPSKDRNMSPQQ